MENDTLPDQTPSAKPLDRYYLLVSERKDDLTVVDVVRAILRKRILISILTIVFILVGFLIAQIVPIQYEAKVLVAETRFIDSQASSSGTDATVNLSIDLTKEEAIEMFTSRRFLMNIIEKYNMLPVLFEKKWDEEKSDWDVESDDIPTLWNGYEKIKDDVLDVATDAETGLTTVSAKWPNASLTREWATMFVAELNETLRRDALDEAQRIIDYLKAEIANTEAFEVRQALYEQLAGQMARAAAAEVHKEFFFRTLDPAIVPEEPAIKYLKLIIVVAIALLGLFFTVALIILSEAIRRNMAPVE